MLVSSGFGRRQFRTCALAWGSMSIRLHLATHLGERSAHADGSVWSFQPPSDWRPRNARWHGSGIMAGSSRPRSGHGVIPSSPATRREVGLSRVGDAILAAPTCGKNRGPIPAAEPCFAHHLTVEKQHPRMVNPCHSSTLPGGEPVSTAHQTISPWDFSFGLPGGRGTLLG